MAKLPAYEMVIDDAAESDVEVSFIALVDKPAIEKNFLAFNDDFVKPGENETKDDFVQRCVSVMIGEGKEQDQAVAICNSVWENKSSYKKFDFAIDAARQIISGPAMVPDTLIYRRDAGGEYNVFFSKDTIESIALKFFKKDYQKNLNLFHDPALSLQGVTIFESFVSDKARGIQPMKGFEDLPDGTWFISAKVENPEVWAKVQTGEVKGFSVEGIFSYMKKPGKMEVAYKFKIGNVVSIIPGTEHDPSHKGMAVEIVGMIENNYAVRMPDGTIHKWYRADELRLDETKLDLEEVLTRTYNADGHIPQKDFMSKIKDMVSAFKAQFFDGTPLTPAPAPTPAAPTPQALNTDYQLKDGTPVTIDKLEIGGTVLMGGMPAPAGEYELADGTKCTIGEGGLITAITPAAAAEPVFNMAAVELAIAKAINSYKEEMATERLTASQKLSTAESKITKQQETITGLFGLIEQLAETPTSEPVIENKLSFQKEKIISREERLKSLVQNIKKLKTA